MQGADRLRHLATARACDVGSERISQMGLQQQLDAFKAEFARSAPVGRPALYKTKIEELRASFALERGLAHFW